MLINSFAQQFRKSSRFVQLFALFIVLSIAINVAHIGIEYFLTPKICRGLNGEFTQNSQILSQRLQEAFPQKNAVDELAAKLEAMGFKWSQKTSSALFEYQSSLTCITKCSVHWSDEKGYATDIKGRYGQTCI